MPSEDLSNWMLEENAKVHEMGSDLRAKVTQRPRGERAAWIADLRARFDDYAAHLRRHRAMEEEGGYLSQVTTLRPTLAPAIEVIRHEHAELTTILDDVQVAIHELTPTDNLLLRDCCRRIEHFLAWIERHEEHENHIVMYAFTQDIGSPG